MSDSASAGCAHAASVSAPTRTCSVGQCAAYAASSDGACSTAGRVVATTGAVGIAASEGASKPKAKPFVAIMSRRELLFTALDSQLRATLRDRD